MSRNAPKERSKDQISQKEKDQSIAMLEDLLKVPGNEICAECSAKGPRWASINLGIFICIRCSGIHRNMGAHISKVKSVTLDFWTYEWVEGMRRMGNRKSNIMWEANLPSNFRKPTENDNNYGVEQFIRDKYERKKWYNPAALSGSNEVQDASSSSSTRRSEDDDRQRRERREQRRREKEQQQQLLLQQQQQQQFQQQQQQQQQQQHKQQQQTSPQKQPNSVDDLFADFSTPTSSNSAINFGDFQSAGFFSSSSQQQQPQPQTQQQNTQSSANSFFGGGNADFFSSNNSQAVDTKAKEKEEILSLFRTPNPQQGYGYGQQYGGGYQNNMMMMNNQPNFTSSAIHSYGMGGGMGNGMGGGMNTGVGYQNNAMNNYNNNMMMMNNNVAANNFNAMNNNFGFTNPGMPQTPQSSNSAFRF